MTANQTTFKTIGGIAREEGVPTHRVGYAVDAYPIEESCRVGIIRLFDDAKVAAIKAALRRIANQRGEGL